MLARHVRRAQLVELALYAILSLWLLHRGWSAVAAFGLVPALMLGTRWAAVCAMFALAWVHRSARSPQDTVGPLASCAMLAREAAAFLTLSLLRTPWAHRVMGPDPRDDAPGDAPVVLVHGYFVNRGCWAPLAAALARAGVAPVFAPDCRSWLAPIERFEEDLHAAIERVSGGRRVVLVAHSMGGLAARLYLARRGRSRVAKLITIGTPHHGTRLAAWGMGANARQMEPGSGFLAELEAREAACERPPVVSIYSLHDNMIIPQESSRLEGARNIALRGLGHVSQFADGEVARLVLEEVRRLD